VSIDTVCDIKSRIAQTSMGTVTSHTHTSKHTLVVTSCDTAQTYVGTGKIVFVCLHMACPRTCKRDMYQVSSRQVYTYRRI